MACVRLVTVMIFCIVWMPLYGDVFFNSSYAELHFLHNTRVFKPSVIGGGLSLLKFPLLESQYDRDKIVVYKFLESQKYSYIFFIEDVDANHYVIKQQKSGSLVKQFRVVCEMLCAHMAELLEIPAHLVRILPAGVEFPGKFLADRTASLHTKISGTTVRDLIPGHQFAKLDIKQNNDCFLSFDQMGLNRRV